jgi:O-antigen/teichoic acid export membrane protein
MVLSTGLTMVATPQAVKALQRSQRTLRRLCRVLSAALAVASLAWGAVLLSLSNEIGAHVMGSTWTGARDVVLPLTLAACGTGIVIGAQVGLRAAAAANRSMHARAVVSALVVAAAVSGAVVDQAQGAAYGLAIAAWVGTVLWWRQLARALEERVALEVAA